MSDTAPVKVNSLACRRSIASKRSQPFGADVATLPNVEDHRNPGSSYGAQHFAWPPAGASRKTHAAKWRDFGNRQSQSIQYHLVEQQMNEIGGYDIEDLETGMSATFAKTITETDILFFAAASGDNNAVHINEEFARTTPFKGRIAHGMQIGRAHV